ncbi:MAG: glycosyltransferase [Bacteroidales bacterium]
MKNDTLHILYTTAWYPNRIESGDGVFVEKHARAISRKHRVSVLLVKADYAVRGLRAERVVEENGNLLTVRVYVPKVRFEVPVITGILRFLLFLAGSLYGYRRIVVRRGVPDISHVNVLTRAGLLPYLLKKTRDIPYIITEHWTRYQRDEYPKQRIQHWFTRKIVGEARFVAPVSKTLQRDMERKGLNSDRYTTINNVVDTEIFTPRPSQEGDWMVMEGPRKKRMVHVSWMRDAAKNISGMLHAVAELKKKRSDFTLVLVGEGNDKERLMELARTLGLEEVVTFLPAKQGEALAEEIRISDFMVLFSNYENQPVCILEALSCGIPVLATRVGAIEEMLDDHRGIVIAQGDSAALEEQMDWLLDHHDAYDPVRLHHYIEAGFSPRAVLKSYDALYGV